MALHFIASGFQVERFQFSGVVLHLVDEERVRIPVPPVQMEPRMSRFHFTSDRPVRGT